VTLVDTGPLVALADARDDKHKTAVSQLRSLIGGGLAVCDAALTEACFHLPHPSQRRRLRALVHDLRMRAVTIQDEQGFRLEVFDWLAKYEEHEPDWADGCLAVLCGRDTSLKVWTYDREFHATWRRPDGTSIPLAVRR
jgi:predicted nucleic acid-binding protein